MVMRWYFREHKIYAAYNPNMTFTKKDTTRVQCYSDVTGLGMLIMLKAFTRTYLNGKKLRITWGADLGSTNPHTVQINDGLYDVSSDTDFPSGANRPTKGAGLLQTLFSHITFPETTEVAVMNTSGGNQTYATIFINTNDAWSNQQFRFWVEKIEILDAGDVVLLSEDFTDAVTMQRTGGTGDYGYISSDTTAITGFRVEGRDFKESKF